MNRIQYRIDFDVNQSSLTGIKKSLADLKQMVPKDFMRIDPKIDLNEARSQMMKMKNSINEIERAYDQAFDSDLGVLNLQKFNQGLNNLDLAEVESRLGKAGVAGQRAFTQLAQSALTTNVQLKQTTNWLDSISKTLGSTIKWGISSRIMNEFVGTVQGAYGYVKELDKTLNDIRIVTGKNADEMRRFAKEANTATQSLGETTTSYTKASLIYYQQGLSDEETKARAETTLKAANVTGQSGEEVSEQLTAVWNGYKVAAEETELYVDKLAAVAATTASDLEELSTGMSKVASAASTTGVSIDELSAQMSTIISVTRQAPESVGTALKTIYARMTSLELGETDEDGMNLAKVTQSMSDMGIEVLDETGNLRDLGTVIEEVGAKWNTWTEAQRSAMAQTLAGTRQYNNLYALFENWDMYLSALETSQGAAGTLQKQQDTYMESTEAHLDRMAAAAENFQDSLLDDRGINVFADIMTTINNLLAGFTDSIGGGTGAVLNLGAILTKVFKKQIATGVAPILNNIGATKFNKQQFDAVEKNIEAWKKQENIQGKAAKAMLDYQTEMKKYWHLMSDEEKKASMKRVKEIGYLEQLQEEWDNANKAVTEYANSVKATGDTRTTGEIVQDKALQFEGLASSGQALRESGVNKSKGEYKDPIKAKEKAKEYKEYLKVYEEYGKKLKLIQEQQKKGVKFSENESVVIKQLQTAYDGFDKKQLKVIQTIATFADKTDELEGKDLVELNNALREIGGIDVLRDIVPKDASQKVEALTEEIVEQSRAIKENSKEIEINEGKRKDADILRDQQNRLRAEAVTEMTSALMSMGSIINNIQAMGGIWSNEDLTLSDKIGQSIGNIGMQAATIGPQIATMIKGLKEAKAAGNGAAIAFNGIGLAIMGLSVAVGVIQAIEQANKAARQATIEKEQAAIEETKAIREEINANKDLVRSYQQLREEYDKGLYNRQEMYNKTIELCKAYAGEIDMLDLLEGRYENVEEAIKAARLAELEESKETTTKNLQSYENMHLSFLEEQGLRDPNGLFQHSIFSNPGDYATTVETTHGFKTSPMLVGTRKEADEKYISWLMSSADAPFASTVSGSPKEAYDIPFTTTFVLEAREDLSSLEGLVKFYHQLQDANNSFQEIYGSQVIKESAIYGDISSLLTKLQPQVTGIEKEYEEKGKIVGEISAYNLDFGSEKDVFSDYLRKRKELYDDILYSVEAPKADAVDKDGKIKEGYIKDEENGKYYKKNIALDENEIDKIIKDTLTNILTAEEPDWLNQENLFDSLKDRFGDSNEEMIKQAMDLMSSYDFKALMRVDINEIDSLEQLGIYIERAKALAERETIEVGLQLTEESINTLLEGGEIAEEQLQKLEKQYPELAQIWDKDSRAYLEALQKIQEEQENALNSGYFTESSFNWKHLNDAVKDYNNEVQEINDQKVEIISTEDAKDSIRQLEEEFEAFFKTEYNLQLSVTDDILTDIDRIISKAESTQKAVSLIGNGFKTSAEDSQELFEIFPELAQDAEILADGTLQLNQKVVEDVLKGYGIQIDADKEKTINSIQNRIAELEMHRADLQKKLEYVKETAAGEIEYDKLLGEDKEKWADYESQLSKETEENQVINSAASAEKMIEHWSKVQQAAIDYAKTAAAAAKGEVPTGPLISEINYGVNTDIKTSTEVTGTEEVEQELDEVQEQTKQNVMDFLQNLIDSDTEQIADLTAGAAELIASMSSIETAGNAKTIDLLEDTRDIYHNVNVELGLTESHLDKLIDLQEQLTGQELLDNIREQNAYLEKQNQLTKDKYVIMSGEKEMYKQQLLNKGFKFDDETGAISNYWEAMQANLSYVNSEIEKYQGVEGKEEYVESLKEEYEQMIEAVEKYDELLTSELPGLEAEMREIQKQIVENNIKAFDVEINMHLETKDVTSEWNDFIKDFTLEEDDFVGRLQQDAASGLGEITGNLMGESVQRANEVMAEIVKMQSGEESEIFENDMAKAQEKLKEIQTEIINNATAFKEYCDSIEESYFNLLDSVDERLEEHYKKYEQIQKKLTNRVRMTELVFGENAYGKKAKLYEAQHQANVGELDARRRQIEMWKEQLSDPEISKEEYDRIYGYLIEAQNALDEKVIESLEFIKAKYENAVHEIFDEMNKELLGMSLDNANLEWEFATKMDNTYLDTIEKGYELQKLSYDYEKSKNGLSENALKRINALQAEQMEYLREKENLTQYDIDRANAVLDIEMKRIALEEAENNKTSMRLRRDSQGNYSYQFVADQDAINEAKENLADAERNLYDLDKEKFISTSQEMEAYLAEVREEWINADAEGKKVIEEKARKTFESMGREGQTAYLNLAQSSQMAADSLGLNIGEISDDYMNNLFPQMDTSVTKTFRLGQSAEETGEKFGSTFDGVVTKLKEAGDTYDSERTSIEESSGVFFGTIEDDADDAKGAVDDLNTATGILITTLSTEIDTGKGIYKGMKVLRESMKKTRKGASDTVTAITNMVKKWNDVKLEEHSFKVKGPEYTDDASNPNYSAPPSSINDSQNKVIDKTEDIEMFKDIKFYYNDNGSSYVVTYDELREFEKGIQGKSIEITKSTTNARGYDRAIRMPVEDGGSGRTYWFNSEDIDLKLMKFDTGGYTGEWNDTRGRLALLHQKELILNAQDTPRMLEAINITREMQNFIEAMRSHSIKDLMFNELELSFAKAAQSLNQATEAIQQQVQIEANFPDVKDAKEIEEALNNLVNMASQYAYRSKR